MIQSFGRLWHLPGRPLLLGSCSADALSSTQLLMCSLPHTQPKAEAFQVNLETDIYLLKALAGLRCQQFSTATAEVA